MKGFVFIYLVKWAKAYLSVANAPVLEDLYILFRWLWLG